MCEAPTPFIIGLMRNSKNDLFKLDISDVFVIDLDKHKILKDETNGISQLTKNMSGTALQNKPICFNFN